MRLHCSVAILLLWLGALFAAAEESVVVRGTVVGQDGKPMRAAMVVLIGSAISSQKQFVDPLGQFAISLKEPGSYNLIVTGVHHKTLFVPIFIDKPQAVGLRIRLAASEYRPTLTDLRLLGDFNNFSDESGGVVMQLQPDGSFVGTVDWKGETLSYVIQGVLKGTDTICGTQADAFAQDKRQPFIDNANNQLVSVIKTNGQTVRILFDPRLLPSSTTEPDIHFDDASGPTAAVASIDRMIKAERRRLNAAREAYLAAGGDPKTYSPDETVPMRRLESLIGNEQDPFTRQYLMVRYFEFTHATSNVELAQRVFAEVPAESRVWSSIWGGPENVFGRVASAANTPSEGQYIAKVYDTNPNRETRAAFLYIALGKAFSKKDANTVARLYTRLLGDFGDTRYAKQAMTMAPSRNIQKGKPVPDFAFASLDNPADTVTAQSLAGRTYLIDFWAVWCGPCVAEMPNLNAAYEKFKDKGLTIITVSLDEKASDVAQFRKTKWSMPWFNARLPSFEDDTARSFEIVGIPKPILVGPDGRIIAVEGELRGEALFTTVARVLDGSVQR